MKIFISAWSSRLISQRLLICVREWSARHWSLFPSSSQSRHSSLGLPSILVNVSFSTGKAIRFRGGGRNCTFRILCLKDASVVSTWIRVSGWKVAQGDRRRRIIFCSIIVLCQGHFLFKNQTSNFCFQLWLF